MPTCLQTLKNQPQRCSESCIVYYIANLKQRLFLVKVQMCLTKEISTFQLTTFSLKGSILSFRFAQPLQSMTKAIARWFLLQDLVPFSYQLPATSCNHLPTSCPSLSYSLLKVRPLFCYNTIFNPTVRL